MSFESITVDEYISTSSVGLCGTGRYFSFAVIAWGSLQTFRVILIVLLVKI